jgi:GAF domain-containing protein
MNGTSSGGSPSPRRALPLADELSGVFARMSGLLLSEDTVERSLSLIGALAQETVPGAVGAGVSVIDERNRRSSGSTDDRVRRADALQYELDEGPCLTAAATRELVRIDDLAEDARWPTWAAEVAAHGLRAAMSAPMVAGEVSLGAIKVYAEQPRTFDAHSEQVLTLFAAQAAILVANMQTAERARRLSEGMRAAIHSRDVVSIAKGMLMGRHSVDEDTALGMLLARSEADGITLPDAAQKTVGSAVRRGR